MQKHMVARRQTSYVSYFILADAARLQQHIRSVNLKITLVTDVTH